MRILITGAAGNLGSATCRTLCAAGMEVIGFDRRPRTDLPVPVRAVDLRSKSEVYDNLPEKIDAAAHFGNHIDFDPPDPQLILNENVAMNMNVFQAAVDRGATKLIFASSVQVNSSVPRLTEDDNFNHPAYLPMDENSPVVPTNPYGLSKEVGETMLRYFTRVYRTQTISVRWPWMFDMANRAEIAKENWRLAWQAPLGFSFMSFDEAAQLVLALLRTDLPGYRAYFPARRENLPGVPTTQLLREYYAGVPLRKPLGDGDSLVDTSRIERETGWKPEA